tara:strand:+ start:7820 stop:8224 length:405 start_codon:yes stop_codon:yes gene_type:complete
MKYIIPSLFCAIVTLFACQSKSDTKEKTENNINLKDIELVEALEMMKQENVITIDIRTPEEIAKGKILDSALEMDYYADDYKSKLEAMNRDDQYVVYCRSGGRSGKTLKMMKDMGFTNAYNVLGGYNAFMELKK